MPAGESLCRPAAGRRSWYVAGFCVCNDVSERAYQTEGTGQVKLVRFGVSAARLHRMQERYERQEHRRLAAIERLAARSGPARTDRSASARIGRRERDAKQRAAAAASGQALPAQLQRRGRRQNVSGLLPLSGDKGE